MPSLILGILSMLCYAISNVYWKFASKEEDYTYLVIFRGLFASLLLGIISFFCNHYELKYLNTTNISPSLADYLECICLCLICSLGLIFFLTSLRFQQLSVTIPLTAINIFNILTTVFILHEGFRKVYFVSFPLTVIGVLSIHIFRFNKNNIKWNSGVIYAFLASFFWGITYPFFKYFSNKVGAINLSFILESCVTLSACIWLFMSKQKIKPLKELIALKKLKHYFILTILLLGGTIFLNVSVQTLSLLTLNLLSNLQLVFSFSIGVIIFKEKLTTQQIIGALLILSSIIITQYFA
jgi:drug/metabolite transporter (DMT)-like permease